MLPPPAGVFGVDRDLLVDVDEFGTQLCNTTRRKGWAPVGETPKPDLPTKVGPKRSTILAVSHGA